jgi:high-affinity Fe2+/Pb2+ permease
MFLAYGFIICQLTAVALNPIGISLSLPWVNHLSTAFSVLAAIMYAIVELHKRAMKKMQLNIKQIKDKSYIDEDPNVEITTDR